MRVSHSFKVLVVAVAFALCATAPQALAQSPGQSSSNSTGVIGEIGKPPTGAEALGAVPNALKSVELASKYRQGKITADEHARGQVQNGGSAVGSVAGARIGRVVLGSVGAYVGSYVMCPEWGAWIGGVLGDHLGSWVGSSIASAFAEFAYNSLTR